MVPPVRAHRCTHRHTGEHSLVIEYSIFIVAIDQPQLQLSASLSLVLEKVKFL